MKIKFKASTIYLVAGFMWGMGAGLHVLTVLSDWHASKNPQLSNSEASKRVENCWREINQVAISGGLSIVWFGLGAMQRKKSEQEGVEQ